MQNANNQNDFDLDVEQMIDKLLISDSDVEDDDGSNGVNAMMAQPQVPQQQQKHGNEHNHMGPHQRQLILLCKRCHGDHLTRECPHGGSIHGIGRDGIQVFRTGGQPHEHLLGMWGWPTQD